MWGKLKVAAAWAWQWITVIAAVLVGGLPFLIGYLDQAAALNLAAFMPPDTALKIVTAVAVLKWTCVGLLAAAQWVTGRGGHAPEEAG